MVWEEFEESISEKGRTITKKWMIGDRVIESASLPFPSKRSIRFFENLSFDEFCEEVCSEKKFNCAMVVECTARCYDLPRNCLYFRKRDCTQSKGALKALADECASCKRGCLNPVSDGTLKKFLEGIDG